MVAALCLVAAVCLSLVGFFVWSLNDHFVATGLAVAPSASGGVGTPVPNLDVQIITPDRTVLHTRTDQHGFFSFNVAKKDKDKQFSVIFPDEQPQRTFPYQWLEEPFKFNLNGRT